MPIYRIETQFYLAQTYLAHIVMYFCFSNGSPVRLECSAGGCRFVFTCSSCEQNYDDFALAILVYTCLVEFLCVIQQGYVDITLHFI